MGPRDQGVNVRDCVARPKRTRQDGRMRFDAEVPQQHRPEQINQVWTGVQFLDQSLCRRMDRLGRIAGRPRRSQSRDFLLDLGEYFEALAAIWRALRLHKPRRFADPLDRGHNSRHGAGDGIRIVPSHARHQVLLTADAGSRHLHCRGQDESGPELDLSRGTELSCPARVTRLAAVTPSVPTDRDIQFRRPTGVSA